MNTQKIKDAAFYFSFAAIPFMMFILVNIVINGNSILLAFQSIDASDTTHFAGFDNFKAIFEDFRTDANFNAMLNRSVIVYVVHTLINTLVPIIFSYYIYKKLPGHKTAKVMLFIPTILSSIITVSLFKMVADEVLPNFMVKIFDRSVQPLLSNPKTTFNTILFYFIWMGFGSGLLTQLAAMNTVDESVKESAYLEGIGFFQELWYIVLPACYEVLILGIITGVASVFTINLNLYAFYGLRANPNLNTLGYYFQVRTIEAQKYDYNYLSAWGLLTTAIAVPATLLVRHLLYKYGPSEDTREKKHV